VHRPFLEPRLGEFNHPDQLGFVAATAGNAQKRVEKAAVDAAAETLYADHDGGNR
jgi:hypothetical protein